MTIFERFKNVAKTYSNKIAIKCENFDISYLSLSNVTKCCIENLLDIGLKKGDLLAAQFENNVNSVVLLLAASALGVCLVPISPTIPAGSLKVILSKIGVNKLVCLKKHYDKFKNQSQYESLFCFDKDLFDLYYSEKNTNIIWPKLDSVDDDSLYVLTPTSGVSGEPKFIALSQKSKLKRIDTHINLFDISQNDIILSTTPLYHSLAMRLCLMSLLSGGTSIIMKQFESKHWFNIVHNNKVTFSICVSTQLAQIAQQLSSPFLPEIDSLRLLVSSSAPLEAYVRNELIRKLPCDLYEIYGNSECSTVTSINLSKEIQKRKSVGKAIKGASVKIKSTDGFIDIGEILCKSDLIASGYYGNESLWNESFDDDGYFKTKDLGSIDGDQYVYFHSRKDELIISDGMNVYPEEIEQCLLELPEILECSAFTYPDDRVGDIIAAAVVLNKQAHLTEKELIEYCEEKLADYQRPSNIFILEKLPKNEVGKILKNKIVELVLIKLAGRYI